MKAEKSSWYGHMAFFGAAISLLWPAAVAAQSEQDCENTKRLVALAFDDFPGMHGKSQLKTGAGEELRDLRKEAPGYKSCQLFVHPSLRADSPTLICDLMKSFDIAPIEGMQTRAIIKNWRDTLDSVASDLGKCLAVKPVRTVPSKVKEGYESENWYLLVERPQKSRFSYVTLALLLDQPKEGVVFDKSHQVKAQLWVERKDEKKALNNLSLQPPSKTKVMDFMEFVGLRHGDTISTVKNLYGEPLEVSADEESGTHEYFYGDKREGLRVAVDAASGKVKFVNLRSPDAPFWLRRRGVDDLKMNLLGLHKNDVIARLGPPKDGDSYQQHWEATVDGKVVFLSIMCTDGDKGRCTRMNVGWIS